MFKYFYFGWLVVVTGLAQAVSIEQSVLDNNGGRVEIGDRLTYTVSVVNDSGQMLESISLAEIIPQGAKLIQDSLGVVSSGEVTVSDDSSSVIYQQEVFSLGEEITITYEVVVEGSPLYFVDNVVKPAILYQVDKRNGSLKNMGRLTDQIKVYGLALTSDAQTLYGVNSQEKSVFKYDVQTGMVTELGDLGLGNNVNVPCLDFDNQGVLWGADSRSDRLFQIDMKTGAGEFISALELDMKGGDCAFGADGQLYVLSNNNGKGKAALWIVEPQTGKSGMVASISETEYMTGLALGVDGKLYASGNKSDGLFGLDPVTGEGYWIGSFDAPHNGGDFAMAASQKLELVSVARYEDSSGHHQTNEHSVTVTGEAPSVGGNETTGAPSSEREVLIQDYCLKYTTHQKCVLPINFVRFMAQYIDDVIEHHFVQAEEAVGEESSQLGLDETSVLAYLVSGAAVVKEAKQSAFEEAHQMVDDWVDLCEAVVGPCPHENILLQNIREKLTYRQAQAAVRGKRAGEGKRRPMSCALYGQDSLIRFGDEITLAWDTYGASQVVVEPFLGTVGVSGFQRIRPLETNTFTLTASNPQGDSVVCEYRVVVEPACDLGAHQKVIKRGEGTTLFWNAEGHGRAQIDAFGDVGLKADRYVTPVQDTTYQLTGYADGQATPNKICEYTIHVVDPEDYCTDNDPHWVKNQ